MFFIGHQTLLTIPHENENVVFSSTQKMIMEIIHPSSQGLEVIGGIESPKQTFHIHGNLNEMEVEAYGL